MEVNGKLLAFASEPFGETRITVFIFLALTGLVSSLLYHVWLQKGKDHAATVSSILRKGYSKENVFKARHYYATVWVIPPKFIQPFRNAPEKLLSFQAIARERFLAQYTLIGSMIDHPENNTVIKSITNDLSKCLRNVVTAFQEELEYGFETEIGHSPEWKECSPTHAFTKIIALMSGRVFVGPELNHDETYIDCIINFTLDGVVGGEILRKVPAPFRWFAQWFVAPLSRCRAKVYTMRKIIEPSLKPMIEAMDAGGSLPAMNMIYWNLKNSPPHLRHDMYYHAHNQLISSAASIHTTSLQLAHAIFDLATRPQYMGPLREEVLQVIQEEAAGELTKPALAKLRKLDSFLKESQRHNPLAVLTFERRVETDLTLPNGIKIKKGEYIGTPASEVNMDPELFDNPKNFDPFRFENMRKEPGSEIKHQFVSTSLDSLNFGYGKHSCPGRFLAGTEIKLIFAWLLVNYEIKLPDGDDRPANIDPQGTGIMADPERMIMVRKRVSSGA